MMRKGVEWGFYPFHTFPPTSHHLRDSSDNDSGMDLSLTKPPNKSFTIDAILSWKPNAERQRRIPQTHIHPSEAEFMLGLGINHSTRWPTTLPYHRPLHHTAEKQSLQTSTSHSQSLYGGRLDAGDSHVSKATRKSKRVRTIFTPEQLERLESEFERQQYMVGPERLYLAAELQLTEAQVKVWFQNRRIKWRKQQLEQQHAQLASYRHQQETSEDNSDSDGAPHL